MTCDKCGEYYNDEIELQEFHFINFTGGYGSVFGDESQVEADICQYCLQEMIGSFCRMQSNEIY